MIEDAVDATVHADAGIDVGRAGLAGLTRRSALFALGAVAGKVVGLVMLPVLTRALTQADYGRLDVLLVLTNALTAALLLGLDVATLRLYFDQRNSEERGRLIASWYVIALIVTAAAAGLLVALANPISAALFSTSRLGVAIVAVAAALIAGTVQTIVLTVLRAEGRAGSYAALSVGALVLYAVLAVVLLGSWRTDAAAVLVAWAAAISVSSVAGTTLIRRRIARRPAWNASRRLLRLGLPLAPAVVAVLVSDFLVRIILLRASGADQVADFTVGNRFASAAGLAVAVLQLAWVPRAYALGTTDEARRRIGSETAWIVGIVSIAVLVIAAGAREIVEAAAGPAYLAALPALGFSLVAVLGSALYLVASMPSALARTTEDLGMATAVGAVVAVAATLLLAPLWAATGTAAAAAIAQVSVVGTVGVLGRRRGTLALPARRLVLMAGTSALAALVLVAAPSLFVRLGVTVAALAAVASALPLRQGLRTARAALPR